MIRGAFPDNSIDWQANYLRDAHNCCLNQDIQDIQDFQYRIPDV